MQYQPPPQQKSTNLAMYIGCGCVALLFVVAVTGAGIWLYLKQHPKVRSSVSPPEPTPTERQEKVFSAPEPDVQWTPGKDQEINYIAAIKARTGPLLFFEDSMDTTNQKDRDFRFSFDADSARAIYWHLNMKHPEAGKNIPFRIDEIWYRDGKLISKQSLDTSIDGDWISSYHYDGWGYQSPGQWKLGAYSVDLFVNGVKITSGFFDIGDSSCDGRITLMSAEDLAQYENDARNYDGQTGHDAELARKKLAIAYHNRGANCYLNGGADAAIQYYTKALNIAPEYPRALIDRGKAYDEIGNHDAAMKDLNDAVRLAPDDPDGYVERALILLQHAGGKEAVEDLKLALKLDPKNPSYFENLGIAHWQLWNRDAALQDFQSAINLYKDEDAENRVQAYVQLVQHSYPIVPSHSVDVIQTDMPQ